MKVTAGCQCGGVRYVLEGDPLMTYACHCRDCQRRTGSAFSEGVLVLADQIILEGKLSIWQRESDSGTRLVFDSTEGITNIVERMHETIARRPLPWDSDSIAPLRHMD